MNFNHSNLDFERLYKCPICSSKKIIHKYTTIDRYYHFVKGKFKISFCKSCKVYFLNPFPQWNLINFFYDFGEGSTSGAYQSVDPLIKYSCVEKSFLNKKSLTVLDRFYFSFLEIENRILDIMTYIKRNRRSFHKVLDVGCGAGYFTNLLFVKFLQIEKKNIIGIDIHPNIEYFGEKLKIKMVNTKIEDFKEYGFDLISLSHVLEHTLEPRATIKELYNRLSKNGLLFICVPNGRSLLARIFGKKWICHNVPRHIYNFSKKSILELTKDLFDLEYYSSGTLATYMIKYINSKIIKILFKNQAFKRLFDTLLLFFNLGDHQNFILKKKML